MWVGFCVITVKVDNFAGWKFGASENSKIKNMNNKVRNESIINVLSDKYEGLSLKTEPAPAQWCFHFCNTHSNSMILPFCQV